MDHQSNRPPTLEVLVGMIASGKSTYARKRAQQGAIVICQDDLVQAVHGGDYTLYDEELRPLYKGLVNHILDYAVMKNRDVVVDKTNLKQEGREKWVEEARYADYMPVAVKFPIEHPEYHARRRMRSDSRGYDFGRWLQVADKHSASYEPITPDEGFHFIIEKGNPANE